MPSTRMSHSGSQILVSDNYFRWKTLFLYLLPRELQKNFQLRALCFFGILHNHSTMYKIPQKTQTSFTAWQKPEIMHQYSQSLVQRYIHMPCLRYRKVFQTYPAPEDRLDMPTTILCGSSVCHRIHFTEISAYKGHEFIWNLYL